MTMIGRCEATAEVPEKRWTALAAAVPGGGHLERGLPCQDRAAACDSPRPCEIVLDGRGSAKRSHDGAETAIAALRQRLLELEPELKCALDHDDPALSRVAWMSISPMLYCTAARVQQRLAEGSGLSSAEFEFTLSLVVSGITTTAWMCVGDSPIVVQRSGVLALPYFQSGSMFANQTHFVQARPRGLLHLNGGVFSSSGLEAVLIMSDGTASKFIDLQAQFPAEANRQIADLLSSGDLNNENLTGMLEAEHWNTTTRDDRSLAILVPGARAEPTPIILTDSHDMEIFEEVEQIVPVDFSFEMFVLLCAPLAILLLTFMTGSTTDAAATLNYRLAALPVSNRLSVKNEKEHEES